MARKQIIAPIATLLLLALASSAYAQPGGMALAIEKHARLTSAGAMVIGVHINCGPFEGVEDFQEATAGGSQQKSGADAEGGIDSMVVCDGVTRRHTASLSSFSEFDFRPGPANANAFLIICILVNDEQMCFSGSTSRRVIIRGRRIQ